MKTWTQPRAEVEKFVPNEYVAACWEVHCLVPYEVEGGYDAFNPGDTQNLHRAEHCGAEDGFVVETDDNGTPTGLYHVKAGSTNNTRDLPCTVYTDSTYTTPRDVSSIQQGETIYFTTVNGRTWHHYGTVGYTGSSVNHS